VQKGSMVLVFENKRNIIVNRESKQSEENMDNKSVVLSELDNHLRHLFEYRFFNKFYNAVEIICRYTLYVTAITVLAGSYLYSRSESYADITFIDITKIVFGVSFLIISLSIIIREITILFYGKIYGETFKQYVAVSEDDINKIVTKLKKESNDPSLIYEVDKIVKRYKYKENGLYVIFTDGINKKIIKELMKLEINYKYSKRDEERR
jgi:hypothetical protein